MASSGYSLVSLVVIINIAFNGFGWALRVVTEPQVLNENTKQLKVGCKADDDDTYSTKRILSIEVLKQEDNQLIFRINDRQKLQEGAGKKDNMKGEGKIEKYSSKSYLNLVIDNPAIQDGTAYRCEVFFVNENNSIDSTKAFSTVAFNACPNGWTHYTTGQKCLKIYGKEDYRKYLKWDDARSECQSFGGDLVQIRDEDMNNFVLNMTDGLGYGPFIGLKNVAEDGYQFQYVDGSPLGSYHPWSRANPRGDNIDANCVVFGSGKWEDNFCGFRRPYACSIPSPLQPSK